MQKKVTKPFLVDVPVRIMIWCRPDCQLEQWQVIKEARPRILFIQSDGGRNKKEWDAIIQNRKMIDNSIDWDCEVYRFYETENLGMYTCGKKVNEFMWRKVDRCISLEDDDVPSISFFQFCADLLEKYKDDQRIECICGHNVLGVWDECNSDYFFSRQGSIHGIATWRRVYEERGRFDYYSDPYLMHLLKQRTKHNRIAWKRLNAYGRSNYYEGHVPSTEFWVEFNMYSQNRLQIVPKQNLIKNIGLRPDSEHCDSRSAPKKLKKIFNMKTYELSFPLKHARYVIPDVRFETERNRMLDYNDPAFLAFFKKLMRAGRLLFVDPRMFFTKLSKRMLHRATKEK